MEHSDAFRAMDTAIDVVIEATTRPVASFLSIRLLFERHEAMFSRFGADSLLSRLNRGETVTDPTFAAAIRLAVDAHNRTGGLFNPMVLPALRDAGYSVTFGEVSGGRPQQQAIPSPEAAIGLSGDSVQLRAGQLDLGGIVKGWTVDLAAGLLGEFPALINAGGDLQAVGSEAGRSGWLVAAESPAGETAWEGDITGGMATSSRLRRSWLTGDAKPAHHLIDPRTGLPSSSTFAQVTAWAAQTWLAEVYAKAALIGGPAEGERLASAGVSLLAFDTDSNVAFRSGVAA